MANEVRLGLIIFSCIILGCKGTLVASHYDAEVDLPLIASSRTVSSQNCLHRCALNYDCNVACVGKAAESEFYCMFFNLVKTATLKDHLRERKGFIVYEVPKLAKETQVPTETTPFTNPPACEGSFVLRNVETNLYISYDSTQAAFVYKISQSAASKFCNTADSLYTINGSGCMVRYQTTKVILQKDCTGTNARISLVEQGANYNLKNEGFCARVNDLSSHEEGAFLYFSSECNDSRLPFTRVPA